jgi:hypothetical protein
MECKGVEVAAAPSIKLGVTASILSILIVLGLFIKRSSCSNDSCGAWLIDKVDRINWVQNIDFTLSC